MKLEREFPSIQLIVRGTLQKVANGYIIREPQNRERQQSFPIYHGSRAMPPDKIDEYIHKKVIVTLENDKFAEAPYRIVEIQLVKSLKGIRV